MGWLRVGALKVAVVTLGLLAASCSGLVGAGAAVVFVGAGVLGFRCYDRVSVTVTDATTGTPLCDAKVTFIEGTSTTERRLAMKRRFRAGSTDCAWSGGGSRLTKSRSR